MHSLQPQQNAQLRPRGHDENILEEAYQGRYARQRLLNFWPESSCGYHAIKRFVCIIQVETNPKRLAPKSHALAAGVSPFTAAASWAKPSTCGIMTFLGCIPDLPLNLSCRRFQKSSSHFTKKTWGKGLSSSGNSSNKPTHHLRGRKYYSFSKHWLEKFSVLLFSVTVRTTFVGIPLGSSAQFPIFRRV